MADLRRVVRYLQREIQEGRRKVGALKLSNLLPLDRFAEDLNISRVRLYSSPAVPKPPIPPEPPSLSPSERQAARQRPLELLQELRRQHSL